MTTANLSLEALALADKLATPPRTAYSYIRFSTAEQAKGDSLRRQSEMAAAYCRRRGWTLDESLTLRDLGVSAFRGKNAMVGNLRSFLDAVKTGRVKAGSVLIVESVDRISRQGIDEGYEIIKRILKAGVHLVTLSPEREYGPDAVKGLTKGALELQLILERAAEESERKSERVGAAWRSKIAAARQGQVQPPRRADGRVTHAITRQLPAWIEDRGGRLCLIPARAAAVRDIFRMAAAGHGHYRILARLRADGVPPFGEHVVREGRQRSAFAGKWVRSTIAALLRDRSVLGEFQPRVWECGEDGRHVSRPDGPPIPGYFPAAVTEEEWYAARGGAAQRLNCNCNGRPWTPEEDELLRVLTVKQASERFGRTGAAVRCRRAALKAAARGSDAAPAANGQRRSRHEVKPTVNVFNGLLRDGRDGGTFFFAWRADGAKRQRLLVNSNSADGAKCVSFPFLTFERAILTALKEIDPREVLPRDDGPAEAAVLDGELTACRAELAEASAWMDANGFSPTIAKRVADLDNREGELAKKLEAARARAACPAERAWEEVGTLADLIDNAADPDEARLRLRTALRRVVREVWLVIQPRGRDRLCAVQMYFADGVRTRSFLILHRPPRSNGKATVPGRWWCSSIAQPEALALGVPFGREDLRDRDEAGQMVAFLERYPTDLIDKFLSSKESHPLP